MKQHIKNSQALRFILVGSGGTVIDFGILFLLKSLGVPVLFANLTSTSIAFAYSFLANKKYTFKTSGTNVVREITLFIVVTLFGLWVIQNIVIHFTLPVISAQVENDSISLLLAKVLATAVSLVWNYVLYNKLVFRKP